MTECPACGARLPEEARDCPACGKPVNESTQQFKAVVGEAGTERGSRPAAQGPALYVRKGPEADGWFYLDRPVVTLGRDPGSDIFLNDVTVSREHAVIECDGTQCSIRDTGSLNGTYVNGRVVDHAVLSDGDSVQIGTFQMVFYTGGSS